MPLFFLLSAIILVSGFCFYTSALNGPFVLDDEPNFYGLRFVHSLSDALIYSYSGTATGRWISYLTFATPIEIDAWANGDAFPFKLINLFIHCINGVLVFVCLRQLFLLKNLSALSPMMCAVGITVIWTTHPLHVNTVLYSVQRMTLLASTAVLAGIYYHLVFISRQAQANRINWIFYTAIIWLITVMGILCKESAVLLPLYILTCFAFLPHRPFSRLQMTISLVMPYLLLLAYLILKQKLGYGGRQFTMAERMLSEVVILRDYIFKIALPSFTSFSLFYDDFEPVKNITDLRFLLSLCFGLFFMGMARYLKPVIPGIWFGGLWFLAGHALESTIIPLELYFDHRNYLPSIGILIIIASLLAYLFEAVKKKGIVILLVLLVVAIAAKNVYLLQQETQSWQSNETLAKSLFIKHPDSMRANQYYIETMISKGEYQQAIIMIEKLHQKFGIYPSNAIFQVGFACALQADKSINHQALMTDLKIMHTDIAISDAMSFLLDLTKNKACPSLTWKMYESYTNSLLANPANRRHYHNLVFLLITSRMQRQDFSGALKSSFMLAKNLHTPQFLFLQMHLSISTKNLKVAESVYTEINAFDKPKKILYKDEITNIGLALDRLRNENKN